jgi:hypothetical protein
MNKKILTKILLPISTITLLGGGIASSLILTECSNSKIIFKNPSEVGSYLSSHSVKLSSNGSNFNYNPAQQLA